MQKSLLLSPRRRLFSLAFLGCACTALPARQGQAQTANASATVAGIYVIESSGVYPTSNTTGSSRYIDTGANNGFPSFTVLDYNTSSFNLAAPVTSFSNVTFSVNESDFASTKAGSFTLYLSENTASISTANGGSPLMYQTANAPSGLGTQLGTLNSTLFPLATFTSSGATSGTPLDTYTVTLSTAAQNYLVQEFSNSSTNNDLRLVLASNDANGYLTLDGNTSAVTTATPAGQIMPTFSFTAALNQPSLTFTPGGTTTGGSGTWYPQGTAGDTSWNGGGWVSADTAIFAGTGGAVTIGAGGVTAAGMRFDVTGYTVGTPTGPAITLAGTAPSIQVTNTADIATINAPIAGTAGINKLGAGTLVLGGTNTFTGGLTITAGTVSVSTAANLGDNGSGVVFNGGTLAVGSTLTSLGGGRAFTGSGGGFNYSGTTPFTVNGDVTVTGALTLGGTGSVTFGDASGRGYDTVGSLNLANPVTVTSTGILNTSGVSATHANGTSVVNGNVLLTSATNTFNVVNAASTLQVTGGIATGTFGANGYTAGTGVLVKTGLGTLDLLGDNSSLVATSATSGSVRQGTASGTAPVSGGTIMVHTATGLGSGQYQFNNGTFSNASGGMLTFANGLSIGGGGGTGFGATFTGTAGSSSTFTGAASLYNPTGAAYQHVITVNVPTTFTGVFSTATGTNNGLLIAGTSSLTLAPVAGAPNTFTEDITVAGGTTLTLGTTGALAANRSLSLLSNASLTLTLGTGAQDAINDGAFVNLANGSRVTLGGANETVGGLALNGVTEPAGTYGAVGSGATNTSPYFTGTGILTNLGTAAAIPEPSAWMLTLLGGTAAGFLARRRRCS